MSQGNPKSPCRYVLTGMPSSGRVVVPLLLAMVVLAACALDPQNGQTVSGSNVGRALQFDGFASVPSATMQVQVLNPATQDPYSTNATWTTVATTTASATISPICSTGPDPLYLWEVAGVVPVPNASALARWPEGGVGRFRVRQNGVAVVSFNTDITSCIAANSNLPCANIGVTCASNSSPVIGIADKDPQPANGLEFLTLKATAASETAQYYAAIGAQPGGSRSTLTGFRNANGFPGGETVTYYFNAGDLGFGRQMHCRAVTGGRVACYVSNFCSPAPAFPNCAPSASADDAVQNEGLIATVAMETMPGQSNDVRFYVYNNVGNIVPSADLDGFGQKPVPGLCLACHGGSYNPSTNVVTGASFLPFDVFSFEYPTVAGYSFANQENAFQTQNGLMLSTGSDQGVNDLVNGWYNATGGVFNPAATADPNYLPSAWSTERDLYQFVVAPFCRTCHVAQGASRDWDSFAEFSTAAVPSFVCGAKFMPHAKVPFDEFWQFGARAHLVNRLHIASACN